MDDERGTAWTRAVAYIATSLFLLGFPALVGDHIALRSRVGKLDERWLAHAAADLQWQERFLRVERDSERLTSECRSATAAVEQRLRGLEESSVRRDVEITHVAKRVGDIGQKLRALVERVESQVPGYRLRRDETRR